jgi:hypothetical protein
MRHLLVADRRCEDLQKQTIFITREIRGIQATQQDNLITDGDMKHNPNEKQIF